MAPAAVESMWSSTSLYSNPKSASKVLSKETDLASETNFAGPLWLREEVGALYAKGEVHTGPFSMPLLRMAKLDQLAKQERYSILDLCCGSGITTHELHELFRAQGIENKVDLVCGDFSQGQLNYLNKRIVKMGWKGTRTVQMDAQKTGQPDEAFDHITCAQGFMILPDSQAALTECHRMLKHGGTFAISVWFKEHWAAYVGAAFAQLPGHPNWPATSEELTNTWAQGPWENTHYVKSMLHRRGFVDVKVRTESIMIGLKDAEDFYEVYDAFIEWVVDRYWTEEEKTVCKPLMRDAVISYMEGEFGKGKPFEIEKVCILATCKRP